MTKREAVIAALEHREVRPVPWSVSLTLPEQDILCEYYKLSPAALQEKIGSFITSCDVVSAAMEDVGNERFATISVLSGTAAVLIKTSVLWKAL